MVYLGKRRCCIGVPFYPSNLLAFAHQPKVWIADALMKQVSEIESMNFQSVRSFYVRQEVFGGKRVVCVIVPAVLAEVLFRHGR